MNISTFYPQHPLLKKHIEYYYFLKADAPDFQTNYYAFPNINIPLTIHKSAVYEIKENYTRVRAVKNGSPAALIQRSFQQPLLVKLQGPIDKVTISFKPFGISFFINRSFGEIAPLDSQPFTEWKGLPAYQFFHRQFFMSNDDAERIGVLEQLLLSVYTPPTDDIKMKQAITLLSEFDENYSIDHMAEQLDLSIRSFNRVFLKHMSISPIAWRKIARFRHSLQNKLFNSQFKKLTEIGYDSNFYDQSYFIKFYKKLTGTNPSAFFKNIDKLADDKLVFRFVKE